MNPGLSYVRLTTSYIKYRAENHVIPHITWPIQNVDFHPASGGWRPLYAGRWAYTSNFVKYILFFKWKLIVGSGHNISYHTTAQLSVHVQNHDLIFDKQEIAANYEKYIRARDPFPWRSIHQNLNSLGNSFCSDLNLVGASLCRYNFCIWQVWHETHICCQGMRKICSDDQKMKYDKMKF